MKPDKILGRPQLTLCRNDLAWPPETTHTYQYLFSQISLLRLAWEPVDPRGKMTSTNHKKHELLLVRYILYALKLRVFKNTLCQTVLPLTTHPFSWHNVTFGDFPLNNQARDNGESF